MTWPTTTSTSSDQLSGWLNRGGLTLFFTQHSCMVERRLPNVVIIFICDSGLCIEWGKNERFIPWCHIDHIERAVSPEKELHVAHEN